MAAGRTWDDLVRYVAPPGYSEHMLGIAVDLYPSNWRFAATPAYAWLKEHAAEYHFVESYPEFNLESFPWEAWHWKYVKPEEMQEVPMKEAPLKEGPIEEMPIEETELSPQTFSDTVEPDDPVEPESNS